MRYRPAPRRVAQPPTRGLPAVCAAPRLLGYIVERYTTTFAAAVATVVTSAFCPYSLRTKGAQEEVSILFM